MSRSFRHTGIIQDQHWARFGKRYANHRVRRSADVPSGGAYRKFYDSWDIHDCSFDCRPRDSDPSAYKDWIK